MALLDTVDPGGLEEFSVVFTDRSLNHMSAAFQQVMRDIHSGLTEAYAADHVAVVPGGGTYGMEAVARQLGQNARALIVRNGWFSYRWSQILEAGAFSEGVEVLCARMQGNAPEAPFAPPPAAEVAARIRETRPDVVFAPHVETSAGVILPDAWIAEVAAAAAEVDALMVLDCIASGCVWVDMRALGVDVLISAPQKGWSAEPCAGLVMMSERGRARVEARASDSFALDLKKWLSIMDAYTGGGHAYHATMPTDALRTFRDALNETREFGFARAKTRQWELGEAVRAHLASRGVRSVAAEGYGAPGVVVSYAPGPEVQSGRAFAARGMQIAAGVPLQVGEPDGFSTFRIGLFGLDKLHDVDATMTRLRSVLDPVLDGADAA